MKITLEYSTQIQQKAGKPAPTLELEAPCTIQELVKEIAAGAGPDLQAFLFDTEGNLQPTILLSINDEQVSWETPVMLQDGDSIGLLSPIAGG